MHNKEITLKAGAARHNFKSNSPEQDAVKCGTTQVQVFKWEKLINLDLCPVDDIRADPSTSKKKKISKKTFSININEHLISGGNALLDTVTVTT